MRKIEMPSALLRWLIPLCGVLLGATPAHAFDPCAGIVPAPGLPAKATRTITAYDLVRLRDIGPSLGTGLSESPLAASPDGSSIAFIVSRADPEANDYCQALILIDARTGVHPRVLQTGRGIIHSIPTLRGVRSPDGSLIVNTPRWSPDGRRIAYLQSIDGVAQAIILSVEGRPNRLTTRAGSDVVRIAWSADGQRLLFADQPGLAHAERAIDDAGKLGFRYDESFVPNASARPSIPGPVPLAFHAMSVLDGSVESPKPADSLVIDPPVDLARPADASLFASNPGGQRAWTLQRDPHSFVSLSDLWVQQSNGIPTRCEYRACGDGVRDLEKLWWIEGGRALLFLRRGGWGNSQELLYRWRIGDRPQLLLATDDLVTGCVLLEPQLVCLHEASNQPRRIISIELRSGRQATLFDPNPEFRSLRLGSVERLHWRNAYGIKSFGDLVLPDHPAPGLPMVVVQYLTRGFLRGGTGDEYPIFALAAQGFAVLSFQRPADFYETITDGSITSPMSAFQADQKDWRDRRSVQSSLAEGIAMVVARGLVDKNRIGITGSSDGATTTQFALASDPKLFAAASISSPFMEANSTQIYGGSAWAKQLVDLGYPPLDRPDDQFWRPISIAENARSLRLPILMQVADDEYLIALEAYATLRAYHQPTELYVFPAEYHVKSQPAHRLAAYIRNIDWFRFWLLGVEDSAPEKQAQYARWRALRKAQAPVRTNSP